MFTRIKNIAHLVVCISLCCLAGCQLGQVTPVPEEKKPIEDCQCETIKTDKKPPASPAQTTPVCPQSVKPPPANKTPMVDKAPVSDKLLIGRVERVLLEPEKVLLKARIDTGAGISSLNAVDITRFERDGQRWVRFAVVHPQSDEKIYLERPIKRNVSIKQLGNRFQRRPVVLMSLVLGSIEEQIEMTLTDRTGYVYQVLIGRNFLRDRAIVDVSDKYLVKIKNN